MRAWNLYGVNDLRFDSVREPKPGEGEVLVEVKAAGICGSDVPRIYQSGAYSFPLIPGHEFSGVVVKLGEGVGEEWLGQRVGVFPLIPCKECEACRMERYEVCRHYSYLGSRRDGGFAEYVAVPVWNLLRLPEQVAFEEAAMLEPMAVAVHAMRRIMPETCTGAASGISGSDTCIRQKRAALPETCTVAICGLGTIGFLLTMFLREAGVRHILAIGNKDFQKEMLGKTGVKAYCDSRTQDVDRWIAEQTDGRGADVFFECVGKNETYALAVRNTALMGKILLMGNPFSDMRLGKDVYWKILRNQLTVTGTWNSTFIHSPEDDWNYVLERLAQKRIAPGGLITHKFPLEEMEKGFHIMRDKTEDYIKIMGVR